MLVLQAPQLVHVDSTNVQCLHADWQHFKVGMCQYDFVNIALLGRLNKVNPCRPQCNVCSKADCTSTPIPLMYLPASTKPHLTTLQYLPCAHTTNDTRCCDAQSSAFLLYPWHWCLVLGHTEPSKGFILCVTYYNLVHKIPGHVLANPGATK